VIVDHEGAGYVARLEVIDEHGMLGRRDVSGGACAEVTSAMALVVALALRDSSTLQKVEPPGPSVVALPPVPEAAPAAPPAAEPAPAEPPEAPVAPDEPAPTEEPVSTSATPLPWELGALATGSGGLLPTPAWGALVFLELGDAAGFTGRLNVGARATTSVERGPGSARFDWFGGRIDGCTPSLPLGDSVRVAACVAFEAGALVGHGHGVEVPETSTDPWLSILPLLRPRARFGSVVLEVEGGLALPLTRRDFVFDEPAGPVPVHEVPAVGWHAGIGAGIAVP
jgi:hypothetical protein